VLIVILAVRMDKKSVKRMSEIPLDDPHSMNP
jgi:hypothetical protein